MAYSRVTKIGDGSSTQFVVNFGLGYLDQAHITARVGTEVDGLGNPSYRAITFLSSNLMQIAGTPAGIGVPVLFERTVPKDVAIVSFADGDVLDEENLDTAQKQTLMAVQEVLDGRFAALTQDLDFAGFRAKNHGAPVAAGDLTTKSYVDTVTGNLQTISADIVAVSDIRDEVTAVANAVDAVEEVASIASSVTLLANNSDVITSTASAIYMIEDVFVGTGVQTVFTLSRPAASKENLDVYVGGLIQSVTKYSVLGADLTITPAVANGISIIVKHKVLVSYNAVNDAVATVTAARDAAASSADDAQDAATAAQTALDNVLGSWTVATRAALASAIIPASVNSVRLRGTFTVGDGEPYDMRRVSAGPATAVREQSADGAWWEVNATTMTTLMAKCVADGVTDCSQNFRDALNIADELKVLVTTLGYSVTNVVLEGKRIRGETIRAKIVHNGSTPCFLLDSLSEVSDITYVSTTSSAPLHRLYTITKNIEKVLLRNIRSTGSAGVLDDGSAVIADGVGTISITNGSPTVTGVGTSFTTYFAAGNYITPGTNRAEWYQILSVNSNTSLTLAANAVTTQSGVAYRKRWFADEIYLSDITGEELRGNGIALKDCYAYMFGQRLAMSFNGSASPNFRGISIQFNEGCSLYDVDVNGTAYIGATNTNQIAFDFKYSTSIWLGRCMADSMGGKGFDFEGCNFVEFAMIRASQCDGIGLDIRGGIGFKGFGQIRGRNLKAPGARTAGVPGMRVTSGAQSVDLSQMTADYCTGPGVKFEGSSSQCSIGTLDGRGNNGSALDVSSANRLSFGTVRAHYNGSSNGTAVDVASDGVTLGAGSYSVSFGTINANNNGRHGFNSNGNGNSFTVGSLLTNANGSVGGGRGFSETSTANASFGIVGNLSSANNFSGAYSISSNFVHVNGAQINSGAYVASATGPASG